MNPNPNQPSRDEIEARITALLLGELPVDEAQLLRWMISQDPALMKLQEELTQTIVLVREAAKTPAEANLKTAALLKLADERRAKLLAHFKTARPQSKQPPKDPLFWLKRIDLSRIQAPRLLTVLVVLAIVAVLAAISLPNFVKARATSQANSVVNNLRQIDAAKNQWALENNKSPDAVPAASDLKPYLVGGKLPTPVMGETYVLGPVSEPVAADVPEGKAKQLGAIALRLPPGGRADESVRISADGNSSYASSAITPQATTVTVAPAPVLAPPAAPIYLPSTADTAGHELVASDQRQNLGAFQGGVAGDGSTTRGNYGVSVPAEPAQQANSFAYGLATPSVSSDGLGDKPADFEGKLQDRFYRNRGAGGSGGGGGGAPIAIGQSESVREAQRLPGVSKAAAESADGERRLIEAERNKELGRAGGEAGGGASAGNLFAVNGAVVAGDSLNAQGTFAKRLDESPKKEASESSFDMAAPVSPAAAPAGSTSLGWFDSGVNRSRVENGPANLGEEFRRNVPSDAAMPAEKLPDVAFNGVAGESSVAFKLKTENSDQLVTSGLRPAPRRAPVITDRAAVDFQQGASATTGSEIAASTEVDRNQAGKPGSGQAPVLGDQPTVGKLFLSRSMTVAGSGALTLNGGNSFSGGTLTNSIVSSDKFYSGLTKDDVSGVRYVIDQATGLPREDKKGINFIISPDTGLPVASTLSQADQQAYEDEKRKLGQMEELHKLLGAKINAEQTDASIPKTSMVQLVDRAEPNEKQSFWQGLKGEYQSRARMKVENDVMDSPGFGNSITAANMPYDPYFIQTTFEIVQSDAVLGRVVDSLNLETAWSDSNGGQKLTKKQAIQQLKSQLALKPIRNTKLIEISATSAKPEEAAKIANAVVEAYKNYRVENNQQMSAKGLEVLNQQYTQEEKKLRELRAKVESVEPKAAVESNDQPLPKPALNAPIPQPEILTRENNFSTFSLNVSDVSFKLATASLEKGQMPEAASIRSEEFINAFDYRDPEAAVGQPLAFVSERARYPFAQNRDLLRFSVKTAAAGRAAGRPLNLVLLLDNSGSMERADRVAIIREALRVLATQLQPQDTVSVVTFARTARLWADGVHGDQAGETLARVGGITPEGGTNLEEAMKLAYETARRHYLANGMNRVVLLTDGAANLGDVNPADLKQKVEAQRQQGIALDCFGIGSQDFNDDLLEQLSRNGDGRNAFLNSPDDASKDFAAKLAGALQVAASDVKVQVEFNPQRVISYRQIGYAKHQLTKEQFRDNTVDAAEIAAQEAGNALYTIETKADGIGPIATVRVRYKVPGTTDYRERSWDVPYEGSASALEQASPAMRLAATASAFSEWLVASPFAQEVTPDELLKTLSGVPQIYGADQRPQKLEWMIRQAKSVAGK
jgi:Mg-chelatase subunit ChlD/type II secretory pathway pseudopilin PulG